MENPIKKLVIKKLYLSDKTKDGKAFVTRGGKPYKKIAIYVDDYPKPLSAFLFNADDEMLSWKVGDTVEVLVEQNGEYYNFKVPTRLDRLEIRVNALEAFMLNEKSPELPPLPSDGDIKAEDLPF